MAARGWNWAVRGEVAEAPDVLRVAFLVDPAASGRMEVSGGTNAVGGGWTVRGGVQCRGGLMLSRHGRRVEVIGDLTVGRDDLGRWVVRSTAGAPVGARPVFLLRDVAINVSPASGKLTIVGELFVDPSWAAAIEEPALADAAVGVLRLDAALVDATAVREAGEDEAAVFDDDVDLAPVTSSGPDVIVGELHDVGSYGTLGFSGIYAFSVGTTSCNAGDTPVSWFGNNNQHPVIAQNMYRLKDGRFEQIGMSWLKHGFLAVTGNSCLFGCTPPPLGGSQLGVGCSDPYTASLNGQQSNLGPRSQVNAHTGAYPYPFSAPAPDQTIGRRLQVHESDIKPSLNSGALYFVEGHYVTADDAAAGNQNNNASFRRASITEELNGYTLGLSGITRRQRPAVRAWREYDSTVVETDIQVPGDGLFILSAKATALGNGFWHYEYALQNLNSDRSAGGFKVPVDAGASVINIGFHDVDYHSGEPFSGTDWPGFAVGGYVTWVTDSYVTHPQANALRWSTLYNFRFDANVPPANLPATIEMFKPGSPATVQGLTLAPATPPPQCGNGTLEAGEQCDPPDGVVCNSSCQTILNNAHRGGLLWDQWWTVAALNAPTGNHPLYPPSGQQTGSATFRCKECHGWDYKGRDGAYGAGAHYTGIRGVFGSTKTPLEMFNLVKLSSGTNGHGFGGYGLSDQDIRDLVQFVNDLAIDTDTYIDGTGAFLGNPSQGQSHYTSGGSPSCIACHGADGATINFGTALAPEWVGTVAVENPWELLHKIRIGNPGTAMPSWLLSGGTDQGAADIGRYAQLNLLVVCGTNAHCDDGKYCNGAEACNAGTCVAGAVPCPGQPCDESSDTCGVADPFRGGLLWDRWWAVLEVAAPAGTHPLYPPAGQLSGEDTFRCVECHGWDYKGASGAYAAGPHYTGIGGVFGTTLTTQQMFDLVKGSAPPDGHGFENYGLTDNDIWDLTAFIDSLVLDTDAYIDGSGAFLGSEALGQTNYDSGGSIPCMVCHGPTGSDLNFGTPQNPEWIGTVAVYDPWRLFHKTRIGNAGGPMPSWLADGGTDQGAADIGRYAQMNFPVDCLDASHCDDGVFCNGSESCVDGFCVPGSEPCPGGVCDESIPGCLSGLCAAPTVLAQGARHLLVTPAAAAGPVALIAYGDPADPIVACMAKYVQADGTLGDSPLFQTPAAWGTIVLGDAFIRPSTRYRVRGDCGAPGAPDLSLASDATTWKWGDVDNSGVVNITDVQLQIKAFQGIFLLVTLERADIEPCIPNRVVNFSDIQMGVKVFQGHQFGQLGCSLPCP
ncbi:MAG: hypothetical protein HY763_17355 [Planctomycetes bacterium]|nr:hypothetical protein [Planctomycetota bacterium]